MKKVLSAILSAVLLFALSLPAFAAGTPSQKEEVVYGILNPDGSVNNLYVVNIFNGGEITDYGSYIKVNNMTASEKLSQSGDQITANTTAKKLYYQGTLKSKELPWNVAIKYILDGKEISGTELAGKTGALKIAISVTKNNNVNSTFYDNYALQITLQLDTKLCENIKADNATIADAGSKKQINYTVLPGKGTDISVTADVHDFQMDAITINGIKLSLNMTIDTERFTGQISELTDAIKKLDDGSGSLLDGANQLSDGMEKYIDGLKAFKDGMSDFNNGANKLDSGAVALKNGLSELSKQNETLVNGASAIQQAAFDTINAQLSARGLKLPALTLQNYTTILAGIPELASVKAQLDSIVQFTEGLKSYTDGVAQLGAGASDLAYGTSQLKTSASKIASSANNLYNAGVDLNSAIKKLHEGLASYKYGTKELRKNTSNIDTQIYNKANQILDDILGNDDKVVSFVSDKNTNVSFVQFVLKTDAINLPKTNKPAEKSSTPSFWQRVLKLFGLYKQNL